jgi:hypothetical protein
MTIQLVNINGRLVGRRFQDRWNLAQLGHDYVTHDRNQTGIKRLRRLFSDFKFSTVRGEMVEIASWERALLAKDAIKQAA